MNFDFFASMSLAEARDFLDGSALADSCLSVIAHLLR